MRDVWQRGESYEAYMGRWSRAVAQRFIAGLGVEAGRVWLDVGCGSGALTAAIHSIAAPGRVVALDRSLEFVAHARGAVAADAAELPFRDAVADAAVSGLVLNFVSEPQKAVHEMCRCVRPGGVVAAYLWDYSGGMQSLRLFWDAAVDLDPAAAPLDEANRFPLCRENALRGLFQGAGVSDVEISSITVPMHFRDFDDLWSPFLGGQGPAPTYVSSLAEAGRNALRERMRERVAFEADGSIRMSATAWVASGRAQGC